MKTFAERTAWMERGEHNIPVGEARVFKHGGQPHTPEMWVKSHLRQPEDHDLTAEDLFSLGEFNCKMIWLVNCQYPILPDEDGKTTYTNALLQFFGFKERVKADKAPSKPIEQHLEMEGPKGVVTIG